MEEIVKQQKWSIKEALRRQWKLDLKVENCNIKFQLEALKVEKL